MKRILIAVLLLLALCLFPLGSIGKQPPCKNSLGECPREGCSKNNDHDPDLNKLKNLKSSTKPVVDRTLTWMVQREQKVENTGYRRGDDRDPLTNLDEGSQARVVGYLLAVKQEHGESCNCHLDDVDVTTDNHLVLVNRNVVTNNPLREHATKKQIKAVFKVREAKSVTAEFTPRVREDGHPNFTSELQKMLNKTPQGALWVRVTGQLFFDSEHFHNLHLNRATQWEIHPILKLELCPKGKTCPKDGDTNWVDLDDVEFE
jgi:hypothetical protein